MAERRPRLSWVKRLEIMEQEEERREKASKSIGQIMEDMAHGMTVEESKKEEVYVKGLADNSNYYRNKAINCYAEEVRLQERTEEQKRIEREANRAKRKEALEMRANQMGIDRYEYQNGDNTRFNEFSRELQLIGRCKVDKTVCGVEDRLDEYYEVCRNYDMRPSIGTLAIAFGVTRATIKNWINGVGVSGWDLEALKIFTVAYDAIGAETMDMALMGKASTVAAIFELKNNHGYRDEHHEVVQTKDPLGEKRSIESLKEKYGKSVECIDISEEVEDVEETD